MPDLDHHLDEHQVGDVVRVGKGKTLWRIESLWTSGGNAQLASLQPLDGYTGTTVAVERLVTCPQVDGR